MLSCCLQAILDVDIATLTICVLNALYDKLWKVATVSSMAIQRFRLLDIEVNTVMTSCHSYLAQNFVSEIGNYRFVITWLNVGSIFGRDVFL